MANKKCYLLRNLPFEIRKKIWIYCIQHCDKIEPQRIEKTYLYEIIGFSGQEDPTYTLTSLALTCHQINIEVCESGLFYKSNEFYFLFPKDLLDYLVAITPKRKDCIRSIIITWDLWNCTSRDIDAFIVLSTCQGLRHLRIFLNTFLLNSGFQKYLSAFQGLETFCITLLHYETGLELQILNEKKKERLNIMKTNAMSRHITYIIPRRIINKAYSTAAVDIHGYERLVKPNRISSRTRRSLKIKKDTVKKKKEQEASNKDIMNDFQDICKENAVQKEEEQETLNGDERLSRYL